jgi:hypothetical protein
MQEWIKELKAWAGKWPDNAVGYFVSEFGLDPGFALIAALLYVALHAAGLKPRITSGFRDPEKQKAMREAWDAGQRKGLVVRPADPKKSGHTQMTWLGKPGSRAIDIVTNNNKLAADIGRALGLRAGYYFTTSDPGHFDNLGA